MLAVLTRELFDGTTTYDRATDRLRATKGPALGPRIAITRELLCENSRRELQASAQQSQGVAENRKK